MVSWNSILGGCVGAFWMFRFQISVKPIRIILFWNKNSTFFCKMNPRAHVPWTRSWLDISLTTCVRFPIGKGFLFPTSILGPTPCCICSISRRLYLGVKRPERDNSVTVTHLQTVYNSVSQPPGRGPVPGLGINYTGPREAWGNYSMLQDFISPVDN